MNKKTTKKIEKFFLGLAIFSVIIAFAEGFYFYDKETYPNIVIRIIDIYFNIFKH